MASVALLTKLPLVEFDVYNKDHRELAHKFVKTGRWLTEAPRFKLDVQFMSVPHMIQSYLCSYYLDNEFSAVYTDEKSL